jgi:ubiquinone/menaquinone biosynthesis C-methylase UbiE
MHNPDGTENRKGKEKRDVITDFLTSRTLANSHRRLGEVLHVGMSVLDVGCGPGSITRGIAEIVGPTGKVLGIDSQSNDIQKAIHLHEGIQGLSFEVCDIDELDYRNEFDIVSASRVIQWLPDPQRALKSMIRVLKPGGLLMILDYNHRKISWEPNPPESMQKFYFSFLEWRMKNGWDNAVADHLAEMFDSLGLENITVTPQHEETSSDSPDFSSRLGVWMAVANSWGLRMVEEGAITESERTAAVNDYKIWLQTEAKSQCLYLLAVEGTTSLTGGGLPESRRN